MWAQTWENIEAILRPSPQSTGMDVTSELVKQVFIDDRSTFSDS
ncbi:M2 family metallopeptidase [Staphylococcus aureus]